jgi:hypothetical protein
MNYNKKYQCVYIRVPRTGTGSLGTILNIGGGHMPIVRAKQMFEDNPPTNLKWEELFKFGFIRNPYTRFASAYYNLGHDKEHDINDFIQDKEKMDTLWKEENVLVRPANDYLCDDEGNIMVDYLGRFEDLHNCWNYIFEKLGMTEHQNRMMITHVNRTNRHKKELTPESKKILADIYDRDFSIFKYEK